MGVRQWGEVHVGVLSWQENEQSFGLDLTWVLVFQAGPQLLCHHFSYH